MLTLQRLQRMFFNLFPWQDISESSPPETARGRGFNFTFTCGTKSHHTTCVGHLPINEATPTLRLSTRGRISMVTVEAEGKCSGGEGGAED